jgi:protein phosphatase
VTGFIKKIFNPNRPRKDEDTIPIPKDEPRPPDALDPHSVSSCEDETLIQEPALLRIDPPQLLTVCAQSVGMQREHNEDALFTLTANLACDHRSLPFGLYIVADGMGGHLYGEIASEIAVRTMASSILGKISPSLLTYEASSPSETILEIVSSAAQEAHRAIVKEAPGGGTTLTTVLILDEQLTIIHVGDSRAYLITEESIHPLTRDHSLVRRLVELGQITEDEVVTHPQRNVLYRALGQGEPFEPDITTLPVPVAGFLLLCSDGLWGVIPEADIQRIVMSTPHLDQACQQLVDAANAAGGPDNISAILVRLPD